MQIELAERQKRNSNAIRLQRNMIQQLKNATRIPLEFHSNSTRIQGFLGFTHFRVFVCFACVFVFCFVFLYKFRTFTEGSWVAGGPRQSLAGERTSTQK